MYYGHNRIISPPWNINEERRKFIAKRRAKLLVDRNEKDDERISRRNKLKKAEIRKARKGT